MGFLMFHVPNPNTLVCICIVNFVRTILYHAKRRLAKHYTKESKLLYAGWSDSDLDHRLGVTETIQMGKV